MVACSERTGRLSIFPRFDDVAYLDDGLRRVNVLHEHGFSALAADYRLWPPHAPVSTLLAFCAFEICGPHDWAPYAANGLLVFGYLLLGSVLLRGIRLWQMLILLALLACVPMSLLAITEFRPDFAASLMAVTGILILLLPDYFGAGLRAEFAGGAFFGLAALAKPTFVPVVIFFFLLCLPLSMIARAICALNPGVARRTALPPAWGELDSLSALHVGKRAFPFEKVRGAQEESSARGSRSPHAAPGFTALRTLDSFAVRTIPAILIPLPHYLIAWRDIAAYIYDVQFGAQRQVWAVKGSWLFHLSYFLIGPGGRSMLGVFVLLIAAVLVVGAISILRRYRRRELALFVLVPAIAWGFLIPSLNRHKQPSFGLIFQLLLVFTTLLIARRMLLTLRRNYQPTVAVALVLLLAVRVYSETRTRINARLAYPVAMRDQVEIVEGVYGALARLNQPEGREGRPESVVLTGIGDLNADLLSYLALKDGRKLNCYTPSFSPDRARFDLAFNQCDAVVAADPRSDMFRHIFAADAIQESLRNELFARPDFRLVARFHERKTASDVYVFEHIRPDTAATFFPPSGGRPQ